MHIRTVFLLGALAAAQPAAVLAADHDRDFFVGLEVLGSTASGTSSTRNGGGNPPLFQGDGIVSKVRFDDTVGVGAQVGYRLHPRWSVALSYQYIRGDIRWRADYPAFQVASDFDGTATSNVILATLGYAHPLSDATSLTLRGGLGASYNRLSGVQEFDIGTGLFLADLAGRTQASTAALVGLGIEHQLTRSIAIGLEATATYNGGFQTGITRRGNLGTTGINRYELDDVWRGNLAASLKFSF